MKYLEKLTPALFSKMNHYLLTNHPIIWRTRAHYFLFYSFIIGNIFAFILPKFAGFLGAIPVQERISLNFIVGLILAAFIVLAWSYDQLKFPLKKTSLAASTLTVGLYSFCLFSLASNLYLLNESTISRLAKHATPEQVDAHEAKLAEYGVLYGKGYNSSLYKDDDSGLQEINEVLAFYHVTPAIFDKYEHRKGYKLNFDSDLINIRMRSIKRANYYIHGITGYRYNGFSEIQKAIGYFLFFGLMVIPALLFIVSQIGYSKLIIIGFFHFIFLIFGIIYTEEFNSSILDLPQYYLICSIIATTLLLVLPYRKHWSRVLSWSILPFIPITVLMYTFLDQSINSLEFATIAAITPFVLLMVSAIVHITLLKFADPVT